MGGISKIDKRAYELIKDSVKNKNIVEDSNDVFYYIGSDYCGSEPVTIVYELSDTGHESYIAAMTAIISDTRKLIVKDNFSNFSLNPVFDDYSVTVASLSNIDLDNGIDPIN